MGVLSPKLDVDIVIHLDSVDLLHFSQTSKMIVAIVVHLKVVEDI